MTSYTLILLLLFALTPKAEDEFKIGLLLSRQSESPGFPTIYSSGGAAQIAVEEVQEKYKHKIKILWDNLLDCEEGPTLISGYDFGTKKNASVIIGPACSKGKFDLFFSLDRSLSDY